MLKIGLFTDAHYAADFIALGTRTCGRSLEKVSRILETLAPQVDAFVQLGDLINATGDASADRKNIAAMQALLAGCARPVYGVLGNHDVEAARKTVFLPDCERGYYSFSLGGALFVVLDGNYISSGESYEDAEWNWTDSILPPHEMDWLAQTLNAAGRPVIVFTHQNLDDRPTDPHVMKNAVEVRALLESSGKVHTVIQGHRHAGGYSYTNGIAYYTLRALCEREMIPCAILTVSDDGSARLDEMELNHQ